MSSRRTDEIDWTESFSLMLGPKEAKSQTTDKDDNNNNNKKRERGSEKKMKYI